MVEESPRSGAAPYSEIVGDLESAIRELWAAEGVDQARLDDSPKPRRYVLGMFPYPSGKAHLGHVMVYSIADAVARLGRFKGQEVLNPLGWDAFGLPAENAAIKNGVHPADWTAANIEVMRDQIGRAGFSFDLSRELNTSSPEFYKWTQWLFLKLYQHGQAYRAQSWVNWDPEDKTVLANEQVIDGRGWRSGALIERRKMEQWCLRITDYAQALYDGLDELEGWSSRAVNAQRYWIGRSEGAEIDFTVPETGSVITVFTTRPDTVFGVTSLTIAPEHPDLAALTSAQARPAVDAYVAQVLRQSEVDRQTDDKMGVATGITAINPLTGDQVPVWVSGYVIGSYGTGAIMNVPAHDQRDFDFAVLHGLPVKQVIFDGAAPAGAELTAAHTQPGTMRDSGPFDGMKSTDAITAIIDAMQEQGVGRRKVRFRLRDWSIGRQRYWGCPIPMLRRADGTWEPVPEQDLPVRLPRDIDFQATGVRSPLATSESFSVVTLPDGERVEREVDTMDTFMDSAWYAWRFLAAGDGEAWPVQRANSWMPIDYYVGGLEHATQHMIYFRYLSHFLHSIGLTPVREPVVNFLDNGMVKLGGSKMSKSKGNTISPEEVFAEYGADTLRMYVLSDTPFEKDREWDDVGLQAKHRFLAKFYGFGTGLREVLPRTVQNVPPAATDAWGKSFVYEIAGTAAEVAVSVDEKRSFHTAISHLHSTAALLRARSREVGESLERAAILGYAYQSYLKMLSLFAPHLADTLWRQVTGADESLFRQPWVPEPDPADLVRSSAEIVVQLNGKVVGKLVVPVDADDDEIRQSLADNPPPSLANRVPDGGSQRVIVVRGRDGEPRLVSFVLK
ncbi:MAG TPA: leucine--tRNA ligase [Actinocrinis sp.]|nr:leucine--tRNA ligase [Actinocrinis sp.]